MINGQAAFVLPRYNNTKYIRVKNGNHFGIIDIIGAMQKERIDIEDWYKQRHLLNRQFSVQSTQNSEVLNLQIVNLYQMQQEFLDCFNDIFLGAMNTLKKAWINKLEAMQKCSNIQQKKKELKAKNE